MRGRWEERGTQRWRAGIGNNPIATRKMKLSRKVDFASVENVLIYIFCYFYDY